MVRGRRRLLSRRLSMAGLAMNGPELIALALAVLSVACWLFFRCQAEQSPIPDRDIIYKDTDRIEIHEPLVSDTYRLTGKPDYIVRTTAGLVPVEVKTRACGEHGRYEGEVAELVAYCLLVEDVMGEPVPKGLPPTVRRPRSASALYRQATRQADLPIDRNAIAGWLGRDPAQPRACRALQDLRIPVRMRGGVGIGVVSSRPDLRVALWNVQWARPASARCTEIRERLLAWADRRTGLLSHCVNELDRPDRRNERQRGRENSAGRLAIFTADGRSQASRTSSRLDIGVPIPPDWMACPIRECRKGRVSFAPVLSIRRESSSLFKRLTQ